MTARSVPPQKVGLLREAIRRIQRLAPSAKPQSHSRQTYHFVTEDARTIHSIKNNPIWVGAMESERFPEQTRQHIHRELLPCLPPIISFVMRLRICENIRPQLIIPMHHQPQRFALGHALHEPPVLTRVVRSPDIVADAVLEQQHVRIVEVVDIIGDEVELVGLDGRLVFLCPAGTGEEEDGVQEASPSCCGLQPHNCEMVMVRKRIKMCRWLIKRP